MKKYLIISFLIALILIVAELFRHLTDYRVLTLIVYSVGALVSCYLIAIIAKKEFEKIEDGIDNTPRRNS